MAKVSDTSENMVGCFCSDCKNFKGGKKDLSKSDFAEGKKRVAHRTFGRLGCSL